MPVGYVYFIKAIGLKKFKIGKASVLPRRFGDLDTASPCDIEVWGIIKSRKYNKIEKQLHNRFNKQRLTKKNGGKKEWFSISEKDAAKAIEDYGGIHTMIDENCADECTSEKASSLLSIYLSRAIDYFFPEMEPHPAVIYVSAAMVFLFNAVIPTVFLNDWKIPKGAFIVVSSYMILIMAFSLGKNKLAKASLIAVALWTKYMSFNGIYEVAHEFLADNFFSSFFSILIFFASPILFYRILAAVSETLHQWQGGIYKPTQL